MMKELGTRAQKMGGFHAPAQPLELPHAMSPHLLPCGVIRSLLGAGDEAACFKIDFIVTQVVGAGTDQKTTALEKKSFIPHSHQEERAYHRHTDNARASLEAAGTRGTPAQEPLTWRVLQQ